MTITFKALAALLTYPTPELLAALPEVRAALDAEARLKRRERGELAALIGELQGSDPLDAQERYVALFDRGRATSLHLFEHVHGESRDRGQAMVDLKAIYARAGLALAGNELPDYLPAMLEFVSLQPPEVAQEMVGDSAHLVRKIGEALAGQGSRYAAVFAALLALCGEQGLSVGAPPREPEKSLDEEWVEEPVLFGRGSACGAPSQGTSVVQFIDRPKHVDQGVPR